MQVRCPCCGAVSSIDVLISHDDARDALATAFQLSGELGRGLLRYLGLFRSSTRELTMTRVAKLAGELLPDIQAQRISRNRQVFDAPPAAWIYAFNQAINARDSGKLTLPLKSHGWLYEVISNWRPTDYVIEENQQRPPAVQSKTAGAIGALESRIRGNE